MANLLPVPMNQTDIEEYLQDYSDFSFELRVLKELTDLNLECSHGGTYDDPITGKSREFDIRALFKYEFVRVHLSVECKNIRDNFPLVVHCLQRKENESYNELIHTFEPKVNNPTLPPAFHEFSKSIRVSRHSLYPKNDYVAKSSDQVGRRNHDNSIIATDGGVFEKISQAINAANDLILEAHYLDASRISYLTFVCPVLVVPDGMLWQINYSDDGALIDKPKQINHVSYYIGKEWTVGDNINSLTYTISHLELVTFSEIKTFIKKYLGEYIYICHTIANRGGAFS